MFDDPREISRQPLLGLLSMTLIGLLVWSSIHAYDLPTWFLETLPVTDFNIADIPVEEGIARLYTGGNGQ